MQGAGATVVARVECCEQVDDFGAADLADYDAVGPHAQRLAYQVRDGDLTGTLGVRPTRGQVDHVRVIGGEFQGVFDGDDALGRVDLREQGGQQRGFAGASATDNHERFSLCDDPT